MDKSDKGLCSHGTFTLVLDRKNKINTKVVSTINKKEKAGHIILNKVIKGRTIWKFHWYTIFLPCLETVTSKKQLKAYDKF